MDRSAIGRTAMKISRRRLMQTAGVAALAVPSSAAAAMPPPRFEGKDTPKIALSIGDGGGGGGRGGGAAPAARGVPPPTSPGASAGRIKQLGVDWVLGGGPPIP